MHTCSFCSLFFQVGRSADSAIDFVVVDTVLEDEGGGGGESSLSGVDGNKQRKKRVFNSVSSVSRYSCRILCEREPPYTARLYAAAFDTNKKIQLSVRKGGREGEIHVITAATTVLLVSYFSLYPLLYYNYFLSSGSCSYLVRQ